MNIKDNDTDIINYNKAIVNLSSTISNLNDNYKMRMNQLYGSSSIDIDTFNGSGDKSKGIGYEGNRLLTIKNPERLNTEYNKPINGKWVIEYGGRDLSLEEDNYRWDIVSVYSGGRGYYIIERLLINGDWLNIRWGLTPTNSKELKEVIHKDRLKNKERIQTDMIQAINSLIGFKEFKRK
jgi:hypothetical protein